MSNGTSSANLSIPPGTGGYYESDSLTLDPDPSDPSLIMPASYFNPNSGDSPWHFGHCPTDQ